MTAIDALSLVILVGLAIFVAARRPWDKPDATLEVWPVGDHTLDRPALRADRLVAGGSLWRVR